ncbi:MAG: hypothetical protein K9W44_03090 [Candidatus Lokiarchaeota archaeon]|nr:hypothetical protein [Candidatus Harpocratesius repetitus]
MPIDFEGICNELFSKQLIIAAVVSRKNGEIVYISPNWEIDPSDLAQCISKWQSHSQFLKLQDVKYSLLMNTAEYFSGVNYKDRTFLCGAISPDPEDQYVVIGFAPAGVDGRSAYVDVVRAANKMRESGSYVDESQSFGKYDETPVQEGTDTVSAASSSGSVNPALLEEINGFLTWINDPNGLAGYIQYYLDQNDETVLAKLAQAYQDFRNVFGF